MVFFTCNHCGESAKKPAVEKHYNTKCRGAPVNVSCMDCQKDFYGQEYVAHTKCISEAQKYSGKDYVEKESKNSGQKKQSSWTEIVRTILDTKDYNLSEAVREAFQKLKNHENIPRKKAKFDNFVNNCVRIKPSTGTQVWDIISREYEKVNAANVPAPVVTKEETQSVETVEIEEPTKKDKKSKKKNKTETDEVPSVTEETVENETTSKKNKKSKQKRALEDANDVVEVSVEEPAKKKTKESQIQEENDNNTSENGTSIDSSGKFDWSDAIMQLLRKKNELPVDKLRKKVLKKYFNHSQLESVSEKQERKLNKTFTKYLGKCNLSIENDIVKCAN